MRAGKLDKSERLRLKYKKEVHILMSPTWAVPVHITIHNVHQAMYRSWQEQWDFPKCGIFICH